MKLSVIRHAIAQSHSSGERRNVAAASVLNKAVRPGKRLTVGSVLGLFALMFAVFAQPSFAEGDPEAGAKKAYTCLGCHGVKHYVNTYPTYHVPKIAGQHETYLIAALKAYRGKIRSHQTMQANAALLTDQDIADIAAYFASVGGEVVTATSGEPKNEKAATCAACHGSDGNSTADSNPRLAGQYKSYLQQALVSYKDGSRENAIMAGFASALSLSDIKELAKYFSAQDGSLETAP